ncbi:MAG: ABC-2 type transport system permease protein [Rhodothermales bacterium]|jgi:ABC-2 type transport system permease protein
MLTGFWKLTWVEIKVFVREPMGLIGSLLIPIVLFFLLSGVIDEGSPAMGVDAFEQGPPFNVAVLAALFMALGAVLSLVAIISIYREGGILKRLRATPLSPVTILGAHVAVKLLFTLIGLSLFVLAGRQFFPGLLDVNLISFGAALLFSTLSILSIGFLIASLVPTARFAQPIGSALLYPMLAISGLFFPVEILPGALQVLANILPVTHAAALLDAVWIGQSWAENWVHVAALTGLFLVYTAISARVFRWE